MLIATGGGFGDSSDLVASTADAAADVAVALNVSDGCGCFWGINGAAEGEATAGALVLAARRDEAAAAPSTSLAVDAVDGGGEEVRLGCDGRGSAARGAVGITRFACSVTVSPGASPLFSRAVSAADDVVGSLEESG
jgi:hypothetical protein